MKINNFLVFLSLLVATHFLTGCGIRSIPMTKNEVEAQLAEVTNQYKRRADLIPNLVSTVKGYAAHEKETLEAVVNARAKATSINIDPSKVSAQQLLEFQKAQGSLSQALGRLMVVVEKYPDLKANENFQALITELEGSENRISVERKRYNDISRDYNTHIKQFPTNLFANFFGFDEVAYFEAAAGSEQAPKVSFD